jgi:hypothetical protein
MVEVICINDENRPKEIKIHKWIKEGEKYNVIFTCTAFLDAAHTKRTLAFQLAEIDLGDDELPYEYIAAHRFAMTKENLLLLQQLIKDCEDTDFSLDELMEQTHLHEGEYVEEEDGFATCAI